jgi:hypothetical protein
VGQRRVIEAALRLLADPSLVPGTIVDFEAG